MRFFLPAFCTVAALLGGCDRTAHPAGSDAAATRSPATDTVTSTPTVFTVATTLFDPIAFFDGHTHSWGVIENRSGGPTQQVETDSHGDRLTTDRLRMVQHLSFQDGKTQQRDWTLWRSGPDQFDATANDMVGVAKGERQGNTFHWRWILARSPGNQLMNVTMNQWMYQLADGSVMIRTTVSKFGIIVAEVSEQFTHGPSGQATAQSEPTSTPAPANDAAGHRTTPINPA